MLCAFTVSQLWRALSFNYTFVQEVENRRMEIPEEKILDIFNICWMWWFFFFNSWQCRMIRVVVVIAGKGGRTLSLVKQCLQENIWKITAFFFKKRFFLTLLFRYRFNLYKLFTTGSFFPFCICCRMKALQTLIKLDKKNKAKFQLLSFHWWRWVRKWSPRLFVWISLLFKYWRTLFSVSIPILLPLVLISSSCSHPGVFIMSFYEHCGQTTSSVWRKMSGAHVFE